MVESFMESVVDPKSPQQIMFPQNQGLKRCFRRILRSSYPSFFRTRNVFFDRSNFVARSGVSPRGTDPMRNTCAPGGAEVIFISWSSPPSVTSDTTLAQLVRNSPSTVIQNNALTFLMTLSSHLLSNPTLCMASVLRDIDTQLICDIHLRLYTKPHREHPHCNKTHSERIA